MKVFIVFIALLLINISFIVYQADMGRFIQMQTFLKALAEECAAGAALYYDEEEYANGRFVFIYDEGINYINYLVNSSKDRGPMNVSNISYEVSFEDDFSGYDEKNNSSKRIPSVTVTIDVKTEDLFRLPFLEVTKVTRMAKYEASGG